MAKVLSSISRDSPAATLSASVNDTFSFAGTPTLSGSGGVQRYDFRFEVDSGSGFVPMSGSTALSVTGTNPIVNTNSQTQNSITVTCAQAGEYPIRMAGAPTSGGAYSVFSATATITVTQAAITGSMAATEAADTADGSGKVLVAGSLAATEAQDTFDASGTVGSAEITGAMAVTEAADTFDGAGLILVSGAFAATEAEDTFSGSGQIIVTGAMAATEPEDIFAGTGTALRELFGAFAAVEDPDHFLATAIVSNAFLRNRRIRREPHYRRPVRGLSRARLFR